MTTALSVINLGLGKIAASRITSIAPARSPLERHCADGYKVWKEDELSKRRWVFATGYAQLTATDNVIALPTDGRRYEYPLPNDCLKPIRNKQTEWIQRGKNLYSAYSAIQLEYIRNALEADFDGPFTNVLACRVAMECVEFATQSNSKDDSATTKYARAIQEAGRINAFVIGPEDVTLADENSEWIEARTWGY